MIIYFDLKEMKTAYEKSRSGFDGQPAKTSYIAHGTLLNVMCLPV